MQIESVSSKVEGITARAVFVKNAGSKWIALGFGQAVPAHVVGENVYSGAAAELPRVAICAAQIALVADCDAFATREGGVVTFEDLANRSAIAEIPHNETIARRATMVAGGSFAGFVGESERVTVDWEDVISLMPKVDHLDRLRHETKELEAARAAKRRGPNIEQPFGVNQGWFLKTSTPRADGKIGWDPFKQEEISGLIPLPLLTAVHGYFVEAMQKEPAFAQALGRGRVEGKAAIARFTDAIIRRAGGKPGDLLYFGHITDPVGENSVGPDRRLLDKHDDPTEVAEEAYMSWFHCSDVLSNLAKRGFDAHSINNLRILINGINATTARYTAKRDNSGMVRLDVGKLDQLRRSKLLRATPAPAPVPTPPPVVKPAGVWAAMSDGSVGFLVPDDFRAKIADIDGVAADPSAPPVPLLVAAGHAAFKDVIPVAHAMEMKFVGSWGEEAFPSAVPIVVGGDFTQLAVALQERLAQVTALKGESKIKFRPVNLSGVPVWGEDFRDWDTALSLTGEAPDVSALAPAPVAAV